MNGAGEPGAAPDGRPLPLIRVEAVTKIYELGEASIPALREVSFDVETGEHVAVVGASGSGKSTLMNILGCLDRPSSGRVTFSGTDTGTLDAAGLAHFRNVSVGFVFQSFNLLPRFTALQNVALPLVYRDCPREERLARAEQALARVGLADRLDHRPSQLSGGQQQRVAIARALVGDPSLLLADEPSGALDSATAAEILDMLDRLHREGMSIIVVTHDDAVAARARRRITLKDGRMLSDRRSAAPGPPRIEAGAGAG